MPTCPLAGDATAILRTNFTRVRPQLTDLSYRQTDKYEGKSITSLAEVTKGIIDHGTGTQWDAAAGSPLTFPSNVGSFSVCMDRTHKQLFVNVVCIISDGPKCVWLAPHPSRNLVLHSVAEWLQYLLGVAICV